MTDLAQMLRDRAAAHGGDKLLEEAAAALSQQRAVPEGYVLIAKPTLRELIGDKRMAQIEAMCVYPIAG